MTIFALSHFRVASRSELCYPFVTRRWGNAVLSLEMMEWGASRILALRKHASMTQSQFAQWLGVSIKQVKYLEHQRRNPSGPTRRLLGILAHQLSFEGGAAVQVLGASPSQPKLPARPSKAKNPPAKNGGAGGSVESTTEAPAEAIVPDSNAPAPTADDEAFVWL